MLSNDNQNFSVAGEENNRFSIREWALEDRPREKMLENGAEALSNAELLAILLGSGNDKENAVELARRMLGTVDNSLLQLGKLGVRKLCSSFRGIGPAKAVTIAAALELGKRSKNTERPRRTQIRNSRDIYELMHPRMSELDHEECWLLLMNNQHRILDTVRVSHGGVSETTVDPKIVLKHALDRLASSLVLCHNHPSGNPQPSSSDDRITQKLKQGCQNMDIQFTDHLIVCEHEYFSYADEGRI